MAISPGYGLVSHLQVHARQIADHWLFELWPSIRAALHHGRASIIVKKMAQGIKI
jgi:hypothetical protein